MAHTDSSPFQSSPLDGATSPRLLWQNRISNLENNSYSSHTGSPSPTRRSSVERLQKAERVKNSKILALEQKNEYDPTRIPRIERPLAKVQGNVYSGTGTSGLRSPERRPLGHAQTESLTKIGFPSPTKPILSPRPPSPSKEQASPIKSSLSTSRFKTEFDPETGTWSAETSCDERELPVGKVLHRHAKSVTFDAAPPQVNEYEMATPDLSSIGSNSRDGSFDSVDDDDDEKYMLDHNGDGQDDSFDASLEDTAKTPVVGPDDWRQSDVHEQFQDSIRPGDRTMTARRKHDRTDATTSNGDHRPLPPLPGPNQHARTGSASSISHRSLPSPPPGSSPRSDLSSSGFAKMSLEERLKLMMLSDDGKTAAEQQRERRMRRAGARDGAESLIPERATRSPSVSEEADDTVGELSALDIDYELPCRISRESILRRARGNKNSERESDLVLSSPPSSSSDHEPATYDPDVPIPSTEDAMLDELDHVDDDESGSVIIKREPDEDAILSMLSASFDRPAKTNQDGEPVTDTDSQYSDGEAQHSLEEEQAATPRPSSSSEEPPLAAQLAVHDKSGGLDMDGHGDFPPGLRSHLLAHPEDAELGLGEEPGAMVAPEMADRPQTPDAKRSRSLSKPEYDGTGWGESEEEYEGAGTPDSVIHRPVAKSENGPRVSPVVPEPLATIKSASGSKLKTRPSVTPSDSVRKRADTGPMPPLPGQQSNAMGLNSLTEDDLAGEMATEENGERGRLFVKVMGVKDLDLPVPKTERTWFSLTLDNGVHCVTTAWLELARNAPIGQEFELVVPNDLEFQLTLNVKLEKPKQLPNKPAPCASSPAKTSRPKASTFSRVFASPKKRREMEAQRLREEEETQRLRNAAAMQAALVRQHPASNLNQPSAWELLSPLAADDGSFARAYICLKEHESRCFGRPFLVEVAAFNEWATGEAVFASSVKSKRSNHQLGTSTSVPAVVRRAPYKIGKLELQLLFVPRPRGATDEDMPKSMNSCIREMRAAEERLARNWEGHLSQQGGDCPYWRRRYFKLVGTKLTAYHETTRQPRATINLANAKRLIDDRQTLTEKETMGKGGRRRRSAFAEEEEGYMFVEEGFRIRFNNGEVIDFYADNTLDKNGWMAALGDVIGQNSLSSGCDGELGGGRMPSKWCELVLKREQALRKRAEGRRVHSRTKSMYI